MLLLLLFALQNEILSIQYPVLSSVNKTKSKGYAPGGVVCVPIKKAPLRVKVEVELNEVIFLQLLMWSS